jgi:hypothetical protein
MAAGRLRVLLVLLACLGGCGGESDNLVRRKLEAILADDLSSLVSELPGTSIADTTYYTVREYRLYDNDKYSVLAVVDFHYLVNDVATVVRKYRYLARYGQWERYYNVYELSRDSDSAGTHGTP